MVEKCMEKGFSRQTITAGRICVAGTANWHRRLSDISSYVLFKKYNMLIGLSLSRIIKENKELYYKSFRTCNDAKNAGDITPFAITFLTFVEKAAESVRDQLNDGLSQMMYYSSMILQNINMMGYKTDKEINTAKNILMLFVQNALFADEPFTISELSKYSDISDTTLRKEIRKLKEFVGVPIIMKGKRPVYLSIDLDQFNDLLQELNNKNDQMP